MSTPASMDTADAERVERLLSEAPVWDSHGCLPLRPGDTQFLPQLLRYRNSGVRIVGINVGYDALPWFRTIQMLAHFRRWISSAGESFQLVETTADLNRIVAERPARLGVFFDIEGGCALNGELNMVALYHDLGVRCMLIAYNRNNILGGGCQDRDCGLTRFGRAVVSEMERVGMTVCCSHTGYRTTMDVMQHATRPVVFSHSNPLGVWRHRRNVRDEAIKACAGTGGVVGINGLSVFLGPGGDLARRVVDHVDYVAQLVGADHVGLGLDYVFDANEMEDIVTAHPELFPIEEGYGGHMEVVPPEGIPAIARELLRRGYGTQEAQKVLGGNFLRVARVTWLRSRIQ